jgi:uroporphyrinogen decarboxylase
MNGRERALRALNRKSVDRVPIYSHFRNPKAIEYVTGMDFADDPFKATAAAYRMLEIDMTKEVSVPFDHAPVGYVVNATGYGINRIKPEVSSIEEFVEATRHFMNYDQMRKNYDFGKHIKNIRAWFEIQQDEVGDSTLITGQMPGCFDSNLEPFGYETFLSALILEPGAAEAAIHYQASRRRLYAEAFVEAGMSDVIMYCDDIAGINGLLASPALMRKYWLPHMRWSIEPLINAGIFIIYHSDGNIRALLDDIADSGFKGLHPLEPKSNMDPPSILEQWGDKFVLIGGLCQVSVLPYGTESEVRAEVRRLLDSTSRGGGYFIGSSGMCGPDIPMENALAWIDEAKSYKFAE